MPPITSDPPAVAIRGLRIASVAEQGTLTPIVDEVDLVVGAHESVALVGESGCGKTLTALAAIDLVPAPARKVAGDVDVAGEPLETASERRLRELRGGVVGFAWQEPGEALSPVFSIGFQIAETIRAHERCPATEARRRAGALLARVGLEDAAILDAYPHQISGGQQQRVVLALALAGAPKLLIADEITSALDVIATRSTIELLADLRRDDSLALLLIAHDLGTVAAVADTVVVMYAGEIVETGTCAELLAEPLHPYTRALLAARPRLSGEARSRGIPGEVPAPGAWPPGCRFAPRCPSARPECARTHPPLEERGGRAVRCPYAGRGR